MSAASVAVWADPAPSPQAPVGLPHASGEVLEYSLTGSVSQSIVGRGQFGAVIKQLDSPTTLTGHERVAIKATSSRGLSLHRTGTISATFGGKSVPQAGGGWTLVTQDGMVDDRKGSTLGGLFLLPLGFLGDRSVDDGALPKIGDRWSAKLGVALFGMTARPLLTYSVVGERDVLGAHVFTLYAYGTAPVREPVLTNEDVDLGTA
ncbi:MAG TPA: hypothetical protein VEJ20_03045, partial [Candidatus Eremiobacteraceae bacterium]|nr:hypothetical protein [Candidatus Eremiobacteraceae bacterium]